MNVVANRVVCWVAVLGMGVGVAGAAGPRNIFDDDWTPPARVTAAATTKPATAPTTGRSVVAGREENTSGGGRTTEAERGGGGGGISAETKLEVRRVVPEKAEQATARRALKEVYAEQLADRSAAGRRKLAAALVARAERSADAPVDQFVLWAAAVEAAVDGADLPTAMRAAERMGQAFEVDGLAIEVDAATRLNPKAAGELAADDVRAGLELVDRLIRAEDFAAAGRVAAAMGAVAGGDAGLRAEVQRRQREVGAARVAQERVAPYVAKLKAAPEDPAANLEVGKYLCVFKDDWRGGLAALAKGSDAGLKGAAEREVAGAETADDRAAVADAWWDAAQRAGGPAGAAFQAHAVEWYEKAAPGLKGLAKARVEKRLADAAAREGWVDLIKTVDVRRATVSGEWSVDGDGLKVGRGSKPAKFKFAARPAGDYRLQVEFRRPNGGDALGVYLPVGGRAVVLVLRGKYMGLDTIGGRRFDSNPTARRGDFDDAGPHVLDVEVSQETSGGEARVRVRVDGAPMVDWAGAVSAVKFDPPWALPGPVPVGLGSWDTALVFSRVRIREGGSAGRAAR